MNILFSELFNSEEIPFIIFERNILKGFINFMYNFHTESTMWIDQSKANYVEFINTREIFVLSKCPIKKTNIKIMFCYNIPHDIKTSLDNTKGEFVTLYFQKDNISIKSYENNNTIKIINYYNDDFTSISKIEEDNISFSSDLSDSEIYNEENEVKTDDDNNNIQTTLDNSLNNISQKINIPNLYFDKSIDIYPTIHLNNNIYYSINENKYKKIFGISNIPHLTIKKYIKSINGFSKIKFIISNNTIKLQSEGGKDNQKKEREFVFLNYLNKDGEFSIDIRIFEKLKGLNLSMDIIKNSKNKKIFKNLEIKVIIDNKTNEISGLNIFPGNLLEEHKYFYNNFFIFIPVSN